MTHLTVVNLLFVLVGLLIHVGIKLVKIQKKQGISFNVKIYWRHNYIQLITSLISAFVVMYFADVFATGILNIEVPPGSNFYELFALAAGFNNQVLFNELMKKNK